ncbi:MAG: hypothetical protein HOP08_01045 [Cyclobacteriaceae bacterium]|nr:hypothetical protein [Cyclobacteriaceae bacterium]
MQILKENPLTKGLHSLWKNQILNQLSIETDHLSLIHYVNSSPKKFYDRNAFDVYSNFLKLANSENPEILEVIINDLGQDINNANYILNEIDVKPIHDTILPANDLETLDFMDTQIHFNLLRIYESPFYSFLFIPAKYKRIKRGASAEGLDLYNVVEELKKTEFSFIQDVYNSLLRNGIGHGKTLPSQNSIVYTDKKGNSVEFQIRDVIRIFDDLVDMTNAFCLALRIFLFSKSESTTKPRFNIPRAFLTEELKTTCQSPGWQVLNTFEGTAIGNRRQLTVYVKNENRDFDKVRFYCFHTAYLAESLTQDYDRIFISLLSSHALPGWAAFNGVRLRELREVKTTNLTDYANVLEDNLIAFRPNVNLPKIFYRIGGMRDAFLISFGLQMQKRSPRFIEVRDSYHHSKGSYLVIGDASVVLSHVPQEDKVFFIRRNLKVIINEVKKFTTRQYSVFSVNNYLPVKYARIFIYDSNNRVRNLRHSGLIPELIAAIHINTARNIKTIDLINCTVEQTGAIKIYWHNNWRGRTRN